MKQLALALVLAVLSGSAAAEWECVSANKELGLDAYVDRATIRMSGSMIKMWDLHNFKTAQNDFGRFNIKPFLSFKEQQEYDCKDERMRTLAVSYHSGQMGQGAVVYSKSDPDPWSPVAPGTIWGKLWKIACGKHKQWYEFWK